MFKIFWFSIYSGSILSNIEHFSIEIKSAMNWYSFINSHFQIQRADICDDQAEPCDILGLCNIGGMCNPKSSCSINKDNGLSVALTIAHEIGHSLNAEHNEPHCQSNNQSYIMNSHLNLNAPEAEFLWSSCSSEAITDFLE